MRCEGNASFHDTWPRQSCNPPSRAHLPLVPYDDKKLNQRTNTQPRFSDPSQSEARQDMLNCPTQPITSRINRLWSLIRCPSGTTQMHSSWTRPTIATVKTRTVSASVFSGFIQKLGTYLSRAVAIGFSETQSPVDWEASRTFGAAPAPCRVWLGRRKDLCFVQCDESTVPRSRSSVLRRSAASVSQKRPTFRHRHGQLFGKTDARLPSSRILPAEAQRRMDG